MADYLLNKVSVEKLDVLHDALMDVVNDMKNKETDRIGRMRDEDFVDCLSLSFKVFEAIRLQTLKMTGKYQKP